MQLALMDSAEGVSRAYIEITGLKTAVNMAAMIIETTLEGLERIKK